MTDPDEILEFADEPLVAAAHVCPECHHLPSGRDTEGVGRCYCRCHDAADAAPALLAAAERALILLDYRYPMDDPAMGIPIAVRDTKHALREAIAQAKGGSP